MIKFRLRTKFLLSLVAISAGLTSATLLIVSYSVQKRVRENLREDLRNSVNTFQNFEKQREKTLAESASLLANLPNVRALMTTQDAATIQDESVNVWKLSGSDLLILADRTGSPVGMRSSTSGLTDNQAQQLLHDALDRGESQDWWFGSGHLYEVRIQPVYFGTQSQNTTIGLLVLGDEINQPEAKDFGNIASSDVVFSFRGTPVVSTLSETKQAELATLIHSSVEAAFIGPEEVQLGTERYFVATIRLSAEGQPVASLSVLKSLDKATAFLTELNHVLIGLGLLSVLAGSALVFLISHTFTKPLANLVGGVRALEKGNFAYALATTGGDEVSEVTDAFIRMRGTLQNHQEEQKKLEERLRQAHKMEAVGRLAGGIAHDFNNLLTIIRGNSDLLIDREGADDFHRRCVDQIQKAAGRAVTMTRQLLAFSRMQVLQPRVLELNSIVAEMGKMLPRLIGTHIEYLFLPGANLDTVKADPGQIEQVILNLAVNARDAMPDGGTLTVRTSNCVMDRTESGKRPPMTPGDYVLLSVTDTGHGMDEAIKAHIFEPFFTTKEIGKGTGLGLATVYGVVKQSNGFIWVNSSAGEGTTFEIYLPRASETVPKPEAEAKPVTYPPGSETVLVVEDEAGVRDLACQFLRVKGYTVLEAANGLDALQIVTGYPRTIHLVLSDMVMPKMNGITLITKLKAIHPDIKVLFMSGYSEYSKGGLGDVSPSIPVLQKPFSPVSLVAMVRDVLAGNPVEKMPETDECSVI